MSRNRLRSQRTLCAATGALALLAAPCAWSADEVQITIQGEIEPSCGLSGGGGSVQLGDISVAGEKALPFTVNCNAPFTYALVSAHGGLAFASGASVIGGAFQALKPYAVSTQFETDQGVFGDSALQSGDLTAAAAAPCLASAHSAGCPFATSGAGIAINRGGELRLKWSAATTPLLAGAYADTITLTVRAL